MMCPTDVNGKNPDCSLKPHVINNSWGAPGTKSIYNVIAAWKAVGIIPVFAASNGGPSCGSVVAPSDSPDVIAVGATAVSESGKDVIQSFSGRGPTVYGHIKPDISAPGLKIFSSYHQADNAFAIMDGTSMAAPHVAGAVALLLSGQRALSYTQVYDLLTKTADVSSLEPTTDICPHQSKSSSGYPNNNYGWGRINVLRAYDKLKRKKMRSVTTKLGRQWNKILNLKTL
jgi:subtilisin family serine protease